jgi:hypothetical protein
MTDLLNCIVRSIELDDKTLVAARRRYLTVKKKSTDIFTGETEHSEMMAAMSPQEILRRAEQLPLLVGNDINIRDIRRPLIDRLRALYIKAGWEAENLSDALNLILATQPHLIKKAVKECKAKYKQTVLASDNVPYDSVASDKLGGIIGGRKNAPSRKCPHMPLNDAACKNAKPSEKPRKLSDEKGLYLEVAPNGGKYWRMKYRYLGKENRLALGVYPDVSLKEARDKRDAARKHLEDGIDPSKEKKRKKLA